ncbi:MAG: sodium:proton antiporter [Pseudomonadota bacterium]
MQDIAIKLALIGGSGIFAQWLAWRLRLPAIVLLLAAGFVLGPLTDFINPVRDFGDIYKPMVGLAVAIILFEGGLTLNFKEIAGTSRAVQRVIFFAGPLVWIGGSLAAHYVGGLAWPVAITLGAVFVITGPTVIMPLLKTAKLKSRPASILRWEAIVNDAIGALFAVLAFETYLVFSGDHGAQSLMATVFSAIFFAGLAGYGAGRFLIWAFVHGHVPDYLKAPILLATVLALFAVSNSILEESGLLTVTIMGITLANSRIASLSEMRRFKETATILLVSGLFILLTAALDWATITSLDWRAAAFVFLLLFVIRPAAVFLVTHGTGLSFEERLLVGWIAPRGIVAVAITGLFGTALVEMGVADGEKMIAFTFAVVVGSIVLHGFSLIPLAAALNLRSTEKPGVLIVGGSRWATALADKLKEIGIPTTISDSNWNHINDARLVNLDVHYGEVLSEHAHLQMDFHRYGYLIAATDNDAYNALVCTDFGPELGRMNVYMISGEDLKSDRQSLNFTLGGIQLFKPGIEYRELQNRARSGWKMQATRITKEYPFEKFQSDRPDDLKMILWKRPDGRIVFASNCRGASPVAGDTVVSFAPQKQRIQAASARKNAQASQEPALPG